MITEREVLSEVTIPAGLKVLLVEDNLQVSRFAEELLKDLGCEVRVAADGAGALDVLRDDPQEVVLTDIVMPGMSGVELADHVRRLFPTTAVVLATGYSDEVAKKRPQYPIVLKPYAANDLSEALARAVVGRTETTKRSNSL